MTMMQDVIRAISKELMPSAPDFEWIDADTHSGPAESSNKLMESIVNKTTCATLSLAAGSSLWIALRFRHLENVDDDLDFVRAVFAGMSRPELFDYRLCYEDRHKSLPKVQDVLYATKRHLLSAIWPPRWRDTIDQPFQDTFHLIYIARHVLSTSQKRVYNEWLNNCIDRMDVLAPRPEEFDDGWADTASDDQINEYLRVFWGQPIPPIALVDDVSREALDGYYIRFLHEEDWEANRYMLGAPTYTGWTAPDYS